MKSPNTQEAMSLEEARKVRGQTIRLAGVSGMIVSVDAAITLAKERGLPATITVGGRPVDTQEAGERTQWRVADGFLKRI